MNNESPKSDSNVEIARMSARTAVIVALITALSGIVGGYFIKSSSPPVQRWLTIHSVRGQAGVHLKLVARVNSIPYSYPADVMTTVIGPNMPEQKCPLPIADNYAVSFEAYFREDDSSPLRNAKNRETPSFAISQLPVDRHTYSLHEIIEGEKRIYDTLSVIYSIR